MTTMVNRCVLGSEMKILRKENELKMIIEKNALYMCGFVLKSIAFIENKQLHTETHDSNKNASAVV